MNTVAKFAITAFAGLVVALGASTACVVATHGSWNEFGIANSIEASRQEERPIALLSGGTLSVELGAGSIRIRPASGSSSNMRAVVHAWAASGETARAALERAKLVVEESAGGVRIHVDRGDIDASIRISADVELEAPSGVALDLSCHSGAIEARGEFARAKLAASHGSIAVEGVQGDLEAQSSSGSIEAKRIDGKLCRLKTAHGSISIADVRARDVQAESGSGSLRARQLRADSIELAATHGSMELADIEGSLKAHSASGSIEATRIGGEKLALESAHGSIAVHGSKGALAIESASGQVVVDGLAGALSIHSSHGSIHADGAISALDIESASGSIEVFARAGSNLERDWKIESSHGGIALELPAKSAFEIDARSTHGDVDVGFDVLVPAGKSKVKDGVVGSVNGGGRRLAIKTASGSVSVRPNH